MPQTPLPLLVAVLEIGFDAGGVAVARGIRDILELEKGRGAVPQGWKRGSDPLRGSPLVGVPAASAAGPNADQVHRAMADIMIGIPGKILGSKFPVAGHEPLLHPTDHLGATLAPIPAVQHRIQV